MSEPRPDSEKRKKTAKALARLYSVLGTVLIMGVLALALPAGAARLMGFRVYNVISGSMAPAIPQWSMVFVRETDWRDVTVGDVIAFERSGAVVTHRVMEIREADGAFVTRGDANAGNDLGTVTFDRLIGRVVMHLPLLGAIGAAAMTVMGKIYLMGLLICGVLLRVLAGRVREEANA